MSTTGLSLRDFEYVIAVAEHGSFVRAAEECHVAQPSLSVQVSKLEARLGVCLFERTGRGVLITKRGEALIRQMRKVLLEAEALFALTNNSSGPFGGTLRLSAISTLGPYLFPRVLGRLRSTYPGLSLVLGEGKTDELISDLVRGHLDAIIISTVGDDPRLMDQPLFLEPFILACPDGHPASRSEGDGWSVVQPSERLLLEEGHCLRDQALAACHDGGLSKRHATSLETLKYMVGAGEGCTLVPALAASASAGITYTPLPAHNYGRTICLVSRKRDPCSAQFEDLRNVLSGVVTELCPEVGCVT